MHFWGLGDNRKDSTTPHITFKLQLGGHRQCGLAICTFHLGFSLGELAACLGVDHERMRSLWLGAPPKDLMLPNLLRVAQWVPGGMEDLLPNVVNTLGAEE